ncbi:MAG: ABC transporter ATP-binding protein [Negativicutes bacterium]|nr:ABC transporter ATP-binding protein [Negativicutes bacterium]
MIRLEHVTKSFHGRRAVDAVSLTMHPGEIFGIVGPDGAGKTTVMRLIAGLLRADKGNITVLGSQNIENVKDSLGYVPQKFSLYGDLTVLENIRVVGALYGRSDADLMHKATEVLAFTKLLPFAHRLADHLSGGMKQKLALAAGLMHQPKLFLLDEPTTGVDPVSRREFWQMLYQLNHTGTTIVVSTPYMDEAELCSRIAFMHSGRVVACASPRELTASYPYKLVEVQTTDRRVKSCLTGLVRDVNVFGDKLHLSLEDAASVLPAIRERLMAAGFGNIPLREVPPTLEDIFVAMAGEVG